MCKTSLILSLIASGVCGFNGAAWAGIRITRVEMDGRTQAIAAGERLGSRPLRMDSTARPVRFHFIEGGSDGRPSARLRFKLEGHDEGWRDLPVRMRAIVYFRDRAQRIVGSGEFYLTGETPGWRGAVEQSDFVARSEQVTAPGRSASVRVSFISHGGEAGMGVLGADGVRLRIEGAGGDRPKVFDLDVTKGLDLTHPLGSPANWIREGSRAELAQLRTRPLPEPHPILVIHDDDPDFFGNWATSSSMPVAPGDRVTLEWQTAHSVGGSSPGVGEYPRLNPGSYFFRVAAAKASGEPTGEEAALAIVVLAPWYRRPESWLVIGALTAAAAAWMGRVASQRQMQRRLAGLEREQALERERARIARDLHDHVGAGLTEIAMQSDWVRSDLRESPTARTRQRVERICQSATELARSVDEIVWAVNPANDTVRRFVNYLTQCTAQFLDAAGLRVRFDIPEDLPDAPLPGKVRHCLFLAVREALHNAARHAQADLVRLEIRIEDGTLRLAVEDDGCGCEGEPSPEAGTQDGIANMGRRMDEIGGRFHLSNRETGGTRVEFATPLSQEPALTRPS